MVKLRVNGQDRSFDGDPAMPLLWYLRDELGLTGTKFGCGVALCGACTVHLDGEAVRACARHVGCRRQAGRHDRRARPDGNHPVQKAWREINVPQCGYCQAGQIMQAAALLQAEARADRRGHRRRDVGQYLPLRLLPAHPRGRPRRRRRERDMTDSSHPRHSRHHQCQPARPAARASRHWRLRAGAAQFPAAARPPPPMPTGADAMPHGVGQRSAGLRLDRPGRAW